MENLVPAVEALANFIEAYAVGLVAVGALSMAIIEAIKKTLDLTARFHGKAVTRWLEQEQLNAGGRQLVGGHYGVTEGERAQSGAQGHKYDSNQASVELLRLVLGVHIDGGSAPGFVAGRRLHNAFFELELSKLMAQLQDAADAALASPESAPHLFAFLTRGCTELDREAIRSAVPANENDEALARRVAAASRVRLMVRRQLDAFQTVTSYRWREWNQFFAVLLGMVVMFLALCVDESGCFSWPAGVSECLKFLLLSITGGALAPVAKDLVDALAVFKRGG